MTCAVVERGLNKGVGRSKGGKDRGTEVRRVSPARAVAFDVLRRVEDEGAFAAPLLANVTANLSPEDRALCYELVLGVLRRQLWLDRVAEHYSGRTAESLDAPVRRALRLGLYQLRFLTRIPSRAAVNESVNLAHAARLKSAAPFINAVLRRATREPEYDPATGIEDLLERVAVETSHPVWLMARWVAQLGVEGATRFASANNQGAPLAFRVNEHRRGGEELIKSLAVAGVSVEPSRVAPGGWRASSAMTTALRELAKDGSIYFQDEASQLVAHVLGARAGERVLDACAAPGSKTTHLASLACDRAKVVAGDVYEHRLRLVAESAARQDLKNVRPVLFDAEAGLPFPEESFERVLVDAPCTGTGTLRHNPEIRWRITPTDVADLAARQRRILVEASRVLKSGGRLVYSTCSVEPEENEAVVAAFLKTHEDFKLERTGMAAERFVTNSGFARTWPHLHDVDGFFVAALERKRK